ncbi:hypothetical protein OD800_17720, partial [Pseudomonas aeruginosa]
MSFSYAVDIEGNSQDIGCCVLAIERLSLAWFYCRCLPAPPPSSPGDRDLIRDRQQRLLDEQRKRLEEL